jgi:CheY-like chemotaxis protein
MAERTHRCTILIVDDDAELQDVLRIALEGEGYAVAVASNGRDAIDFLRSHDTTCAIVLDLMLPEMNGTQFRQIQRRDRALAWIPVVVMSGAVDADRLLRDLGTDLLVAKPVDLDHLREAVARVAGRNCVYARTAVELAGRGGRFLSSA